MIIAFFEEGDGSRLYPLTLMKPVYMLRCGALRIYEKAVGELKGRWLFLTRSRLRDVLSEKLSKRIGEVYVNEFKLLSSGDDLLIVNGGWLFDRSLLKLGEEVAAVKDGEVVVNMFAGVGSFSLVIARLKRAKVYSIDLNPYAIKYMKRSLELNRLKGEVIPILGDAREVIEERLKGEADRVLMPLPERANEFLRHAILALKSGGFVHYYRHSFGLDESDAASRVVNEVKALIDRRFEVLGWRRVREVGPRWFEIVLDLAISL